jgi:hypothetical protein
MTKLVALPPMPGKGRTKSPQVCACGCDGRTKGGQFIPGHDSRRLGWALRIANGHPTDGITPGERAAAEAFIAANAAKPEARRDPRLVRDVEPTADVESMGEYYESIRAEIA